jgi:hypothetical protein
VGPRAGLGAVVKRKIPSPCWDSNPPIIQLIAQHYTTELFRLVSIPVELPKMNQTIVKDVGGLKVVDNLLETNDFKGRV